MMQCASCGREQPSQGPFCQYCGAATINRTIHQSGPQAVPPSVPCACGRSLRAGDLYCPSCGRPASQHPGPAPNYQYPPPPADGGFRTYGQAQATPNPYGLPVGVPPPPPGQPPNYLPVPYQGSRYAPAYVGQQGLYPYQRKDKVVAGLLALFLGGLGIHKFYLGQAGWGLLYLLFCWTFIPAIISGIEGIIYLVQSDQSFDYQYNYRQ